MAVLENIRVKLGVFITILIALSLLSFIVDPSTLSTTFQRMSADNKVGTMNGKTITYQDYYTAVEQNKNLFESLYGQSLSSEEQLAEVRDYTWQSYFDRYVFEPKAADAGINVGDQEMYDLTQGSNISPVLLSQSAFLDENGNFSHEALAQFIQNIDYDATGSYGAYWNYLRDQIYKQQLYSKYNALLYNSSIYNPLQTNLAIESNNLTSEVDFVMATVGFAADSTLKITNDDIKQYYNKFKNLMKQAANRDIEYVMFEVVPSQQDIDEQTSEFTNLVAEFADSDNPRNFISLNSDSRWSEIYYGKDEVPAEIEEFAFPARGVTPGVVSDITVNDNVLSAFRVVDRKVMPDSVYVWYSLLTLTEAAKADSIAAVLNAGRDYDDLHEMGWITQQFTEANNFNEFNAAFDVPVGKAVAVRLPSLQAMAVLKVTDRTKPEERVKLANLTKIITPSDETYRDYLMQATALADKSNGKYENFAAAVKEDDLPVTPATRIVQGTRRIGTVDNAREVVSWAFDAKEGEVSDVITVDNKYYFVTALTKARKEGIPPIEDVSDDIYSAIALERRLDAAAADVAEKVKGLSTLEEMAEALGTTVSHQSGISFGSAGGGLDPSFIGAVASAPKGKICGPVKGQIGVYLFEVLDTEAGAYYTEDDVKLRTAQEAQYRQQYLSNVLSEEADIHDNRARFY
ncbi:MAG: SurA N-terminal domain-containing protein [Bacteroidales bacterium]|nr:SurA N-terminal domain-containing protein [Bacteroidales bacterium]MBO7480445.1 SurA N-terminal domain-containing protein [Bacteroidales bacterium]